MQDIAWITLLGLIAGVAGTGAGGLLALTVHRPKPKLLSLVLGFSAGIMLAIVFGELVPEAFANGGVFWGVMGLLSGVAVLLLLDLLMPHYYMSDCDRANRFVRAGLLLGLGIAMHNFPEGLAIGASYMHEKNLGLVVALIIALHNLPEGMAMAAPMCLGRVRASHVIGATALAGLPMGIGALVGGAAGQVSPHIVALALGFAAGAMLYVTSDELMPNAQELAGGGHSATFGVVLGGIVGILLSLLS